MIDISKDFGTQCTRLATKCHITYGRSSVCCCVCDSSTFKYRNRELSTFIYLSITSIICVVQLSIRVITRNYLSASCIYMHDSVNWCLINSRALYIVHFCSFAIQRGGTSITGKSPVNSSSSIAQFYGIFCVDGGQCHIFCYRHLATNSMVVFSVIPCCQSISCLIHIKCYWQSVFSININVLCSRSCSFSSSLVEGNAL